MPGGRARGTAGGAVSAGPGTGCGSRGAEGHAARREVSPQAACRREPRTASHIFTRQTDTRLKVGKIQTSVKGMRQIKLLDPIRRLCVTPLFRGGSTIFPEILGSYYLGGKENNQFTK